MAQPQEITSELLLDALQSYENEAELIKSALEATGDIYILIDEGERVLWCNQKDSCKTLNEQCQLKSCTLYQAAQVEAAGVRRIEDRWFLVELKTLPNTKKMIHAKDVTELIASIRNGEFSIV